MISLRLYYISRRNARQDLRFHTLFTEGNQGFDGNKLIFPAGWIMMKKSPFSRVTEGRIHVDYVLNAMIAGIMLLLLLRFGRQERKWSTDVLKQAFRFFTVQSNTLCAVSALLMCIFPAARWAWTLKYVGTAAVTVTMLTVLLFLGPIYGYKRLLSGSDLFMHLINPVLALVSFCVFERRGMGFGTAMLGMLPVVLYGALYSWKVLLTAPERRWEDFYCFNKNGRWYLSYALMLLGAFLICLGLMGLQNI